MTTHEKLCFLRDKGVALNHIAKMVDCAPQTITQWAKGTRNISARLEKDLENAIVSYVRELGRLEE